FPLASDQTVPNASSPPPPLFPLALRSHWTVVRGTFAAAVFRSTLPESAYSPGGSVRVVTTVQALGVSATLPWDAYALLGPRSPLGPCWFQLSAVSFELQPLGRLVSLSVT